MRQRIIPLFLSLCLLAGCGQTGPTPQENGTLTILAATYPIYLFARAVTDGVEDVEVERLNTGSVSCLHDYTLSVADMKKIERADVIAVNGAGLEEFMDDALASSGAEVIDCSVGVALLENLSHRHEEGDEDHDDHDHGHWDPHYWMDPENARIMAANLETGISGIDQTHAMEYRNNALHLDLLLCQYEQEARDVVTEYPPGELPGLITFHDGFQYFAHAFGLPLLESIEEEAGSEASAREIVEITQLVREHDIPVIFTEVNGSDATAKAIARETGCQVAQLTMVMDGPDDLEEYRRGIVGNIKTICQEFTGGEAAK